MVKKINDMGAALQANRAEDGGLQGAPGERTGKQLWDFLRPRLEMLVKMETKWCERHNRKIPHQILRSVL